MTAPLEPIAGPYRRPECKVGDVLICARRGRVVVAGFSTALVPWPYAIGRMSRISRLSRPAPILCGDLVRAIRTEATVVVAHLFGVTVSTVAHWRKQLGVRMPTPGMVAHKAAAKAAKRPKK